MLYALILFALTYALMLLFSRRRALIALCSGALFILTGMLPLQRIPQAIDFNVLMMIAGMMGLVKLFINSKMPSLLADLVMERVHSVQMAAVALALFAGIISSVVDNVATVLMVAPVAIEICRKLKTNPTPFIIGIAVSSNLQGAATMVGDTTAIMLGSYANMGFLDFFIYQGKPGMFFAVEIGALLSALILAWIFRREKSPIPKNQSRTQVTDMIPTLLLVGAIVALAVVSFIPGKPAITNGLICLLLLGIGVALNAIRSTRKDEVLAPLRAIDLETLGILLGLFLMIGGITHMGVIDEAAALLARLGSSSVFVLYTVIVWVSVLISAFIDNIPYTATMLPVVSGLAAALGISPTPFYFGLLSGATLGGNCTPIGASANITGIGILRREGYAVTTRDFIRIGIPFTLAAVIPAYLYIWLLYA